MTQQLDEPLDACIPESFVAAQPIVGPLERARVDAAVVDAAANRALHETGPLERLDVLGRRGERHAIRRRRLADRLFALGQPFEHGAPRVVAEGAKDPPAPRHRDRGSQSRDFAY